MRVDDLFAPTHLILIAIIALLVFGPRKLPEIGAGLGRAIREFKSSLAGIAGVPEEIRASVKAAGNPAAVAAPPQPRAGDQREAAIQGAMAEGGQADPARPAAAGGRQP